MKRVIIVGVLNVTPDSFHDGGKFTAIDAALRQVEQMLTDGADIIEIGGESSGPRSPDVAVEEEIQRVMPVIRAIRKTYPEARIGVDTWKSAVAAQALTEGVMMINDVTAGRGDPEMFNTLAASTAQLVLMYSKDPTPRTGLEERQYDDVIGTIKTFLAERKAAAVAAGVSADRIILDPGLGHFVSSDARYSFEVLSHLAAFLDLGSPIFLSPSRKSFLAGPEKLPTSQRLPGTIAASAIAVHNGATYIRTHDVLEVRRACEIAVAIREHSEK